MSRSALAVFERSIPFRARGLVHGHARVRKDSLDDIVVIGGGPAGLAVAIYGALAGLRVRVLERFSLPRDKPCGEGIMPRGVRLLSEMGVQLGHSDARAFDGILYVDPASGGRAVGRFSDRTGRGLAVRRTALSEALVHRARELGVTIHEKARAREIDEGVCSVRVETNRGSFASRYLVGADGLHSTVRAFVGEGRASPKRKRRYGCRRHYRARPWSNLVEVHWSQGAEAYVTPISDHEVGVAILFSDVGGEATDETRFEERLHRFPILSERLRSAQPSSATVGAGPFRQDVPSVASRRIALVGDAAGYLDALTGEGLALGFESARALVGVVERGRSLRHYGRAYRRLSRRYFAVTKLALGLTSLPALRALAIRVLASRPRLFTRILSFMESGRFSTPSSSSSNSSPLRAQSCLSARAESVPKSAR